MDVPHVLISKLLGGDTPLTAKETMCLRLAAQGMTRQDIAQQLNVSMASVMLHLRCAAEKLDASGLQSAIDKATLLGWI
jgi:ATP/maltotriose-dependent transcriptional regulator MalT